MAAFGCGGTVAGSRGEDASADGTAAGDAGATGDATVADVDEEDACVGFGCEQAEAAPIVPCPASPPTLGSPCDQGEACEYGSSWWLECNTAFGCIGGQWRPVHPTACTWLDGGGTCPATFAQASALDAGFECPAADCQYPEGYCECLVGCGGGGQIRKPLIAGRWACAAATAECPSPRPLLGTACEGDASCNYGWPCGCGQMEECRQGVWEGMSSPVCP